MNSVVSSLPQGGVWLAKADMKSLSSKKAPPKLFPESQRQGAVVSWSVFPKVVTFYRSLCPISYIVGQEASCSQ